MLSNFIAKKKRKRKNIFSILNHRTFLPKIACPNHQRSPINISRSSPDVELIIFSKPNSCIQLTPFEDHNHPLKFNYSN